MNPDPRIADEQQHLDAVYGRIDRMRTTTNRRLRETLAESGGTPQAQSERESYERLYVEDLAKLDAAEHNLYFGRLEVDGESADGTTGRVETRRIGRIGVLDDDDEDTTLLLDWRAPMSRPFYLATPADPDGVRVRRHVRTGNREVRKVTDEVLDGSIAQAESDGTPDGTVTLGDVVNESALVAALNAARTGEMTDIVETIQREQDLIIRSSHRGVSVVQGGPGTGKTAVALHRAAYLLYTHRDLLARSGVLIIGPNTEFLRYISQVLPSLGETGVLLTTIGNLLPGVDTDVVDPPRAAVLKGSTNILDVLRRHVRTYQSLPRTPVTVHFDGYPLAIDSALVKNARARARSTRKAHNQAQREFLRSALHGLATAYAKRIGSSLLDGTQMLSGSDIADIRDEMRDDEDLVRALLAFWPRLEPKRVLDDLLSSPSAIRTVTPGWSDADRAALARPAGARITVGDVPLLDEIAELVGAGTADDEAAQRAQWRAKLAEAQEALDILAGSAPQDLEDEIDPEILMAYDLIDAEQLAQRQRVTTHRTTAERAYDDRTWTFGHVIVDEAQELSAMAWRMVMRRIPNRWMTVIGDTAQTSNPAGAQSWAAVFDPYVQKRWRLHELTVNYRTPAEIMRFAARLLKRIDPTLTPPTSLRANGIEPMAVRARDGDAAVDAVALAAEAGWPGLTGIIVADDDYPATARALAELGEQRDIVAHTVTGCKGLEFDNTVVVEPAAILAASVRGANDLYVALTRATQRLVVVAENDLPPELADLPGWQEVGVGH
ncbi:MAG TPA: AAA family ATPase [Gordonia sp. (in: high G+C Gram-positive bacteria)]|uniref:AAA family ATPase n=1 Tax=unclassified Gordonia (in: high G+C Gram-positive bacteria) TaxID=2657482 RepID=UPI000FAB682D|nr:MULTISPECIES: AAA family ATPase [unclassified Gordonia (in: high G+C Gram-positive bacteria)]RUP35738.1 MAG: helicase [Gordonia sp. (in: high G+C Gram-positive bacteria)]HNP58004.1 AAA family ATPase [Gordonia sp. (in: high G+C Gram-positive bacteria)]HRC51743.1 AAA family ATPase [Gordonia sp. (in: high G+C Gram-positive bacteria)]